MQSLAIFIKIKSRIKLPLPEIISTCTLDKLPVMEYNKENKIRGLIDEFCISS